MIDSNKIKELRRTGLSLREISEKLKITRREVEIGIGVATPPAIVSIKKEPTSVKKAVKKISKSKGK